jgi:hypothetical protein
MSEVQGTFLPGHFRRLYEYRAAQARGETPALTPVEQQNMANLQGEYDRWFREETAMRARRSTEPMHPRKALEYLSECYMDSDSSVYGIDEIMVFGGKVWFRWRDGTEHVFQIVLEEDPLPNQGPAVLPPGLILTEDGLAKPCPVCEEALGSTRLCPSCEQANGRPA